MTAATLTLTEFLLARIAADEAWAKRGVRLPPDGNPDDPARVLAECEAKRRIVHSWERVQRVGTNGFGPGVLRELAAVYADHPDYDDEWRL